MKRLSFLTAALAAAIAACVVLAPAGGAQTPGGRTLTFLDDTNHGTQAFVDNAPKSHVPNPQSRRFRLRSHSSPGDAQAAAGPKSGGSARAASTCAPLEASRHRGQ
jgi:hypothetical protein